MFLQLIDKETKEVTEIKNLGRNYHKELRKYRSQDPETYKFLYTNKFELVILYNSRVKSFAKYESEVVSNNSENTTPVEPKSTEPKAEEVTNETSN